VVLDTCKYLERKGFDVTCLTVGEDGMVSAQSVADAIREDTILVTIMFANNETGTIMPMKEIGEVTKKHGVLFHTDAVQAVGHVPIDVNALGIDLLSMSANKFYGPKGVGALYVRDGVKIAKLIHGGSHEKGMRSGTLNSAGIVGLGTAIALAVEEIAPQAAHEAALVQRLKQGLLSMPDTRVNGHETSRLPGNINVSFDGIEAEALLLHLDLNGIAVSAGSACSSGSNKPSYVLQEMGLTIEQARAAVRITVGRENTEQEIDTAIETIKEVVSNLRAISPLYQNKQAKSEE